NGGATAAIVGQAATAAAAASVNRDAIVVQWGQSAFSLIYPNADGVRVVEVPERSHIDIELPALGGATYTGYQSVGTSSHPLPLGSSLAGHVFSWGPAAGFIGSYDLAFLATAADGTAQVVYTRIVVG